MPPLAACLRPFPINGLAASLIAALLTFSGPATARTPSPALQQMASGEASARPSLPPALVTALNQAKIPLDSVSVWTQPVDGNAPPRLAHRADELVSPASTMKLVSTYAALDRLGPAYAWRTRIYTDGTVADGSLRGNLYVQGGGDPKLVMERLWAMLRELQQRGIRVVTGDIVVDRSALTLPPHDAAAFDDEPLRPYNAAPDALLINYKSVVMRFIPEPASGSARVLLAPPMAHLDLPSRVPLSNQSKNCPATWRNQLQLDVSQPGQWRMAGSYPAACGELNWAVAYPDPEAYAHKAIEGMWRELGGSVTGTVRSGMTPAGLQPLMTESSVPLAEIVRDVNKFSNNVMADHVFLAMGSVGGQGQPQSFEASQLAVQQWWERRIGNAPGTLLIDNGSGLSRNARVTARTLGQMLLHAWHSPVMPELMASLPSAGVDGTMRRSRANAAAHIKTGSLRDVNAIAGYVHGRSGQRHALVAIINHPNAAAARGNAFDALIDWVANDR